MLEIWGEGHQLWKRFFWIESFIGHFILFYKIINNLEMVPHSCLEKADGRTRKKHNLKFRHIGYNVDPYGHSFFPKCISAWNGLAQEIAEANTLDLFKSKLAH